MVSSDNTDIDFLPNRNDRTGIIGKRRFEVDIHLRTRWRPLRHGGGQKRGCRQILPTETYLLRSHEPKIAG